MPDPIRVARPQSLYSVERGRLRGPGVFYAPTADKLYRRPQTVRGRPVAVVLHYTAVRASTRPIVDLRGLLRKAGDHLDDGDGAISALQLRLENRVGSIPDAVSLCLQNATKPKRKASWCICIGADPVDDGTIPICQYSPDMDEVGTWHAGSPKTWQMRKKYAGRAWKTSRGEVRWDGRNYQWPRVTIGHVQTALANVNAYTIGIEMMCVGRMGLRKRLQYPDVPTTKIDGVLYEQPSAAQLAALRNVLVALRARYGRIPVWGHRDLTPWSRSDPWPPYPAEL
jgi:hypothetical protein